MGQLMTQWFQQRGVDGHWHLYGGATTILEKPVGVVSFLKRANLTTVQVETCTSDVLNIFCLGL